MLFLGAGVSLGAGLPGWGGLLSSLEEKAGFSEAEREALKKISMMDRAALVEKRLGKVAIK